MTQPTRLNPIHRFLRFTQLRNVFIAVFSTAFLYAQTTTQTIKGVVLDQDTQAPLIGANIIVKNTSPVRGATTNLEGDFWIDHVNVGRYDLLITYIGYEPFVVPEVLVSSAKEVILNVQLEPSSIAGEQVMVEGSVSKETPQNSMAVVSARSFTVEEARRYAGGMDDPARMASSFAGVTTGEAQDNAIVVRGNSAKGLLWQVEGVRIPSPNHFADINVAGGGFVSILSSQVMDNSDFYTGAFPAEYGNAMSGVFDMSMRDGNNEQREYTFQAGVLGVDIAAEGPIASQENASYLFNYRYSTFGIIKDLIPSEQVPEYSDLAYKISVPTRNAGKFSIWGLHSWDVNKEYEQGDSTLWTTSWDRISYDLNMGMSVFGVNHKYLLSERAYVQSSFARTEQTSSMNMYRLDDNLVLQDNFLSNNTTGSSTLSSYVNTRISSKHTNRTGLTMNGLRFDFDQEAAIDNTLPLTRLVKQNDNARLLQFYSTSRFKPSSTVQLNLGFHAQYFSTNEEVSLEPRLGLVWKPGPTKSLSLSYGNHSQMEELRIYFIDANGSKPNEGLELSRAHHLVLAYQQQLSMNTRVKIEPYYQAAYNVPVIQDSSFSMLNFKQDLSFNSPLVNEGMGHNYGIDLTLEQFITKDMYYLFTASIFESRYTGGDGVERNTRYASGYVINGLIGKEYKLGRTHENMLGASVKLKVAGGARRSPVHVEATERAQEVVYDESRAFQEQAAAQALMDLSITFRKNKPAYSSVWALQLMNALGANNTANYQYDYKSHKVKLVDGVVVVPSLSYKIEF